MVQRDGARVSLWQDSVQHFKPTVPLRHDYYDVAIAGAGITGITLAFLLQRTGLKCIVLESHTIGYGTTGGTTAHLNTLLDTPYSTIINDFGLSNAKLVASATRAAIELVKDHVQEFEIDCGFEEEPGFLFSRNLDQEEKLKDIYNGCQKVGLEVSLNSDLPIHVNFTKSMRVERQAKLHPLRYIHALASVYEQAGGVIIERCKVLSSTKADRTNILQIETSAGNFSAGAMVYATHIPIGVNILHLRCPAYRSYAMAVKLEDDAYPRGLCYDLYDPYHYYRTQEIDGQKFLIVGGDDHKTGEEENTNGCFLKLESHIRSHFNVSERAHQWSSQYFEPVDGLPYIGHLPGNPDNVYVATGFGGNGITYSHVAALVLKNLILGKPDELTNLFSPSRIKPVAGFTEFVKHNADVVKLFVGKWFGQEKIEQFASLSPGEAKVVNYEGHTLALYKDDDGGLHAVSPACTHMKCSVSWNAAEKSWDCPCHGSRFATNGEVITGPATRDLEPVELKVLEYENNQK